MERQAGDRAAPRPLSALTEALALSPQPAVPWDEGWTSVRRRGWTHGEEVNIETIDFVSAHPCSLEPTVVVGRR